MRTMRRAGGNVPTYSTNFLVLEILCNAMSNNLCSATDFSCLLSHATVVLRVFSGRSISSSIFFFSV